MSEFCPNCGAVHPENEPCRDPQADLRRLERLKRREIEAVERLADAQTRAAGFIAFPLEGFKLLVQLAPAMLLGGWSPAEIAKKTCDVIDAYALEMTRRWGVTPPKHEPPPA